MFLSLCRASAILLVVSLPVLIGLGRWQTSDPIQSEPVRAVSATSWQQAPPMLAVVRLEPKAQPKPKSYERLIVHNRGPGYRVHLIVRHSWYQVPLTMGRDGVVGLSRRWGDAAPAVQRLVITKVIEMCRKEGYSLTDTAFVLALVRHESGFNPDAAAGTSSAAGFGQFINRTRKELARRVGIDSGDPFDLDLNVACLKAALREGFAFAGRRAQRGTDEFYELVYAYHHDGPALNAGGRKIAQESVMPWVEIAQASIE